MGTLKVTLEGYPEYLLQSREYLMKHMHMADVQNYLDLLFRSLFDIESNEIGGLYCILDSTSISKSLTNLKKPYF